MTKSINTGLIVRFFGSTGPAFHFGKEALNQLKQDNDHIRSIASNLECDDVEFCSSMSNPRLITFSFLVDAIRNFSISQGWQPRVIGNGIIEIDCSKGSLNDYRKASIHAINGIAYIHVEFNEGLLIRQFFKYLEKMEENRRADAISQELGEVASNESYPLNEFNRPLDISCPTFDLSELLPPPEPSSGVILPWDSELTPSEGD